MSAPDTRAIQVGDLVVIVKRPKHGCHGGLGKIFRVASLRTYKGRGSWTCIWCGTMGKSNGAKMVCAFNKIQGVNGVGLFRLKRIPPLSELESEHTDEPIQEPA